MSCKTASYSSSSLMMSLRRVCGSDESLTGTLKGDELVLSTAMLFSEPPRPEMLLLRGDRSEDTSVRDRQRKLDPSRSRLPAGEDNGGRGRTMGDGGGHSEDRWSDAASVTFDPERHASVLSVPRG